jgi:potassium-transporting ATPase KdpC subunit
MTTASAGSTTLAFARQAWAGLRVLIVLTIVLGVLYPLAVTGVGQALFHWRAEGSLVTSTGARTTDRASAVGSALIGQGFDGARWFHSRPSVAGANGYDTLASGGSNLGPLDKDLVTTIDQRRAAIASEEGVAPSAVPADALTASASGLDPDISPAYATLQVARVARENGLSASAVQRLVDQHTTGRDLGVLGEPRVDVLALNLALRTMAS